MTTAVYCRVSTDDKGQDPLNQTMQMPSHELEFVDFASGKSGDREQFKAMLLAAERHEFDALVFWSFDRLTREGALETLQYLRRLDELGIKWRSLTEPYLDSCGPFKDVMVAMIATAAKMERERLSARTKAGMQRVMTHGTASGQPVGRPRVGLESRCRELRAAGLSFKRIGISLGVSPAYVHKSLRANVSL
jgi:DNA invertase Pin-like site-specific DNA recombinase